MIQNLVDITFVDTTDKQEMVEVSWYHVPRVGDHVDLSEPSQMVGKVIDVTWTEDSVWVRVK